MRASEFEPKFIRFADGYLVLSNHFANDRSVERSISKEDIFRVLHKLEQTRSDDLMQMPYILFVVKSHNLGIGMSKQKDNAGNTAYVVTTAHPTLSSGEDQDVLYLEDESLNELSFLGSQCTKDCSGHRAGYEWSTRKGNVHAASWSPSFNNGAALRVAGK